MAVYSIKEISDMTGIPQKNVHTYISRKKLIKNNDKKIDTSNIINKIFIEKYSKDKKIILQTEIKEKHSENETSGMTAMTQVEFAVKKLQANKLQKENELKDIEIQKKKGSLIELEKTILITKEYSDMLKRGLLEDIKLFVQDICARHDIPTGKAGEYKLKIADIINERNSKAIKGLMKKFK